MTVVGEWGSGVKGYDFGRASARSAFDSNVVVNFEVQEVILDYAFDRLSLTGMVQMGLNKYNTVLETHHFPDILPLVLG